ncbi:MAG: response regulator [Acidimicrobiales bacterium]|nr:response regulator [Acidimicrobiales bacterium]MBO0892891.1 response regulator [Acidimicrobiales bacterium]
MSHQILLIDDEELIREVAVMSLSTVGGFTVTTAGSGEEGLRLAMAERPDAILLDVMMPGLDGPRMFEHLQANPATADIPVVLLTAKARPSDHQQWAQLGVAGIVVKPFDPMALPDRVTELLGWTRSQ